MNFYRTSTVVLIIVAALAANAFPNQVFGQGRLSQVRKNVRRHKAEPPTRHEDHNHHDDHRDDHHDDHRDDHHDDHSDDHHDDHSDDHHNGHRPNRRRRGNHRHRGHGQNYFLTANAFHDCHHQPQIVEHVHIYEPVPCQTSVPEVVVQSQPYFPVQENYDSYGREPILPSCDSYFSRWTGRITGVFGSNFDDLSHGNLSAMFQVPGFLGLDTSVSMFRESGSDFRDHLWIGDVNVVYEAINTDDIRARLGVGINWLGDYYGGEAGANLTFGLDWQISPNWVLTGETDLGSIGDTDLFHAQLSIGRQFDRAEWCAGYDHYDIGGAPIGGVFTGLRFRF